MGKQFVMIACFIFLMSISKVNVICNSQTLRTSSLRSYDIVGLQALEINIAYDIELLCFLLVMIFENLMNYVNLFFFLDLFILFERERMERGAEGEEREN